jgi:hypothetical protein
MMRCFKMPGTTCVELLKAVTAPAELLAHTPVRDLLLIAAANYSHLYFAREPCDARQQLRLS